jgi:protein TonB
MKAAVSLYEFMPYGAPELLQSRRERMARALLLGSAMVISLYAAAGTLIQWMASAPVRLPPPIQITLIPQPPPPLIPTLPPEIATPITAKLPTTGIPIPVPEVTDPNDQMNPAPGDVLKIGSQPSGEGGGVAIQPPAGDSLPVLGKFVFVEELPEPITEITPAYPDLAREAGVEGLVTVNVLVGKDGRVIEARLDEMRQVPMLNDAALAAARLWVFKPALANNQPVAVWTAIPFKFHLH